MTAMPGGMAMGFLFKAVADMIVRLEVKVTRCEERSPHQYQAEFPAHSRHGQYLCEINNMVKPDNFYCKSIYPFPQNNARTFERIPCPMPMLPLLG